MNIDALIKMAAKNGVRITIDGVEVRPSQVRDVVRSLNALMGETVTVKTSTGPVTGRLMKSKHHDYEVREKGGLWKVMFNGQDATVNGRVVSLPGVE